MSVLQADILELEGRGEAFDAVVDFAALHHVEDWCAAIERISSLVKPGGKFYFEEVTRQWIGRWPYKQLFRHPQENRFSGEEFIGTLVRNGFSVGNCFRKARGGDFVFGVATRMGLGEDGVCLQHL